MHYNNTCDSVRSYFLKAPNEKKIELSTLLSKKSLFSNLIFTFPLATVCTTDSDCRQQCTVDPRNPTYRCLQFKCVCYNPRH